VTPLLGKRQFLALLGIVATAGCANQTSKTPPNQFPGLFKVKQKSYIFSREEAGVIHEEAVYQTSDAGAKSFHYEDEKVLHHLFVGQWEDFAAFDSNERQEVLDVAAAALDLINEREKAHGSLSASDQRHRAVLSAFCRKRGCRT